MKIRIHLFVAIVAILMTSTLYAAEYTVHRVCMHRVCGDGSRDYNFRGDDRFFDYELKRLKEFFPNIQQDDEQLKKILTVKAQDRYHKLMNSQFKGYIYDDVIIDDVSFPPTSCFSVGFAHNSDITPWRAYGNFDNQALYFRVVDTVDGSEHVFMLYQMNGEADGTYICMIYPRNFRAPIPLPRDQESRERAMSCYDAIKLDALHPFLLKLMQGETVNGYRLLSGIDDHLNKHALDEAINKFGKDNYEKLPILDIGSKSADSITPEMMTDKVMRGVDSSKAPFVAFKWVRTADVGEKINCECVSVLFQKRLNDACSEYEIFSNGDDGVSRWVMAGLIGQKFVTQKGIDNFIKLIRGEKLDYLVASPNPREAELVFSIQLSKNVKPAKCDVGHAGDCQESCVNSHK
jgi:hypothetical protein